MTCSQFGTSHILSKPTKGRGAKYIPITYHHLICGYWRFSICQWKNILCLKSRHTLALSLKRLRERSYTRTTHVNVNKQQSGLHSNWAKYSGRVRLCGTKTASFYGFPKFWHKPNLHLGMYASRDQRLHQKDAGKCNQSHCYDNAIM